MAKRPFHASPPLVNVACRVCMQTSKIKKNALFVLMPTSRIKQNVVFVPMPSSSNSKRIAEIEQSRRMGRLKMTDRQRQYTHVRKEYISQSTVSFCKCICNSRAALRLLS
jgi:hypothetical protein